MGAETLPVRMYLDQRGLFSPYQRHVEMLNVTAKGKVLIIGPGLEEIAIIEPAISNGDVEEMILVGENPLFLESALAVYRANYHIPMQVLGLSFGAFFDANPSETFDTITYFGRCGNQHLEELLGELATRLNPLGKAYLTINGQPPFLISGAPRYQLTVVPDIPPNSNYDILPDYYGVVLQRV